MNYYKKKLIKLLVIGMMVTIIYNVVDSLNLFYNKPTSVPPFGLHWWLAVSYWLFVITYVLRFNCPNCGKAQIIRGFNFKQWHWPQKYCWSCDHEISKK